MPKANSKSENKSAYSAGAREERAVIRRYLRRKWRNDLSEGTKKVLNDALNFVVTRSLRYDKKSGGL